METKYCKWCERDVPIDEWTRYKEGFQAKCNTCRNSDRKQARLLKKGYYANEVKPEARKQACKRYYYKNKRWVFEHYSPEGVRCRLCGFDDPRALSIDHVEGKGNQHRRDLNSKVIYTWIVKEGFPKGFQVLCMNCQFIKRAEENGYKED